MFIIEMCLTSNSFLAAGHETTARALKWGIYTLCRYPDIQHRLRLHIRNAMPSLNHDITVSEIQECHYLQAVCMEVLRVWPPISTIHRVASCDTQINRHYIPKGRAESLYILFHAN
jgi:cytochrome P450